MDLSSLPIFDYDRAFSRNIGWVSAAEQTKLRGSRVAIAGMGGVGGQHLLALTRLGIGRFHVADFDRFEVHNFNRQAGGFMSRVGQPKVDVMAEMAQDINPEAEIRRFPMGVTPDNVDDFLDGVDVYVDGLDFFAIEARRMVFARCHAKGIPAVTAAPLGMGTALLSFLPGSMSFEDYFKVEGHDRQEQFARFIAGLSPAMLQMRYLAVRDAVSFREQRGPSTSMACELCAGVVGTTVLKLLLGRGKVKGAPWVMHFDAYRQQLRSTWRPFGNSHPMQRLLLKLIRPKLQMGAER
jgi:molybdopterin/thiamine biosynthesis adenylyltransferase